MHGIFLTLKKIKIKFGTFTMVTNVGAMVNRPPHWDLRKKPKIHLNGHIRSRKF